MSSAVHYLVAMLVPLAVKTVLYVAVFRWRKHKVAPITCIILAGSPLLLAIIPFPLPAFVVGVAAVGIALYILSRYTKVPLMPEGVAIVCGVELVSWVVMTNVL